MQNWSTVEKSLKKNPKKHAIWRLEQLINFGLGKEKLNKNEVRRNWTKLQIDPSRRAYLKMLLK